MPTLAVLFLVTCLPVVAGTGSAPPCLISSNFNGTPIGGGDYIWFSSVLNVQGLDTSKGAVTVTFQGSTIQFTTNGTPYMLVVPSARITFDPKATSATTTFTGGLWVTNVPASGLAGNVFLNALAFQAPAGGFPGGIQPVTWQGTFSSAASGLKIQWQWGGSGIHVFQHKLQFAGRETSR